MARGRRGGGGIKSQCELSNSNNKMKMTWHLKLSCKPCRGAPAQNPPPPCTRTLGDTAGQHCLAFNLKPKLHLSIYNDSLELGSFSFEGPLICHLGRRCARLLICVLVSGTQCCVFLTRRFTLTACLSTQVNKWTPANFMLGVTL